MNRYILDACALIAVFNSEIGAEPVKNIIEQSHSGAITLSINSINLLEVYYGIFREYGSETANRILSAVKVSPIKIIDTITDDVFEQAGRLKAAYKISLADSIVLAEGLVSGAMVISSDHHEFDVIEKHENIEFLWIR